MKNFLKSFICAALAAMVTGCATVTCTTPGKLDGIKFKGTDGTPSQLVYINSASLSILWIIPLFSGDIRWNSKKKNIEGGFSLFRDHMSRENMQKAITNYADSRDCDLLYVDFNESGTSYASASQVGIVGTLFGSTEMNVSAVLVPRNSNKQGK